LLLKILKKYSEYNDEQLVQRYHKTGDAYYASLLFERYNELTVSMSLSYLKNRMDAEDATMECFEVLVKDLKKAEVKNFGGWYYSVVRNLLLKYKRKNKKEQTTAFEDTYFSSELESEMDFNDFLKESEKPDLEAVLNEVFDELKVEQAQALKLFFLKGKSYDDVAEEMDIEIKKVKSYIQNGKRKMKILLEKRNIKSSDEIL
jgi:RNA polymerase sigma-70 factor (ECF subfamily)